MNNIESYINGDDVQSVVVSTDEQPSFCEPFVKPIDFPNMMVEPGWSSENVPRDPTPYIEDNWEDNLEGRVLVFGSKPSPGVNNLSTPIPEDNEPTRRSKRTTSSYSPSPGKKPLECVRIVPLDKEATVVSCTAYAVDKSGWPLYESDIHLHDAHGHEIERLNDLFYGKRRHMFDVEPSLPSQAIHKLIGSCSPHGELMRMVLQGMNNKVFVAGARPSHGKASG